MRWAISTLAARPARALTDHSMLLAWMRLDPRMDALRDRQCFADVEKRVYGSK